MQDQIRQGDVLLVEVDVIPPGNIITKPEVILAEGEVTGHTHRLLGKKILDWSVNGQRYIRVEDNNAGAICHEEHDPKPVAVVLPGKTYQVIPQQEWNLENQWQKVQD